MSLIPMETAIDPAGDMDAAMAAVLGMIGIFFEMTAYGEVYQRTLRWLRKRTGGRWGNNTCPPSLSQNVVALIWDGIFLVPGILAYVWVSRVFGVLWCLFPVFLAVMHFYQTFIKRYDREKSSGRAGNEPETLRRLEQLESLKAAGILSREEYQERREKIEEEL